MEIKYLVIRDWRDSLQDHYNHCILSVFFCLLMYINLWFLLLLLFHVSSALLIL